MRTCFDKSKIDATKSSCQNILSRVTLVMIFLGYEVNTRHNGRSMECVGVEKCQEVMSDVLKSSCQNKLLSNE